MGDRVSDDLVTLKALIISEVAAERQLLRQAASQASVPIELIEVDSPRAEPTCELLTQENADVIFLDSRMGRAERKAILEAARAAVGRPLVILVGSADIRTREVLTDGLGVDGVLAKPINPVEARAVIDGCVRARLPNRVLIVDDSSTVRSVVRKVLQASRFRLEAQEASEGAAALERARSQHYDIIFLDYNMPGFDGFETLAELQHNDANVQVVMITGTNDQTFPERARASGAKDVLFKPFFAKDIDEVLNRLFGLMPQRG